MKIRKIHKVLTNLGGDNMKLRKLHKVLISMGLIIVGSTSVVFSAVNTPTQPRSTDDSVIRCAGNGATGVMIETLGGNLVGAGSAHLSLTGMPLFMPVFGTDNNQNPDPWVYNYFYNTTATTKVTNASTVAYGSGTGGTSGPGGLDTTLNADGIIPMFVNKPDLIVGSEAEIGSYAATAGCKPLYVSGPGMENPEQILGTVKAIAAGMQKVIDNSNGKLKARYGNPTEVADKFGYFYLGMINKCTKETDNYRTAHNNMAKPKVINVTGTSGSDWTVQAGAAKDIFVEYIKAAGGDPIGQTDGVMTTAELAAANVIVTRNNKQAVLKAFSDAGYKEDQIPRIYSIPTGVYLWSVRSCEGALTTPWLTGLFYPELANEINPVYTTAYFYSNYYHYTGKLESLIGVVLNSDSFDGKVDLTNYNPKFFDDIIKTEANTETGNGGSPSSDNTSNNGTSGGTSNNSNSPTENGTTANTTDSSSIAAITATSTVSATSTPNLSNLGSKLLLNSDTGKSSAKTGDDNITNGLLMLFTLSLGIMISSRNRRRIIK